VITELPKALYLQKLWNAGKKEFQRSVWNEGFFDENATSFGENVLSESQTKHSIPQICKKKINDFHYLAESLLPLFSKNFDRSLLNPLLFFVIKSQSGADKASNALEEKIWSSGTTDVFQIKCALWLP
jgi:hypothetical protein